MFSAPGTPVSAAVTLLLFVSLQDLLEPSTDKLTLHKRAVPLFNTAAEIVFAEYQGHSESEHLLRNGRTKGMQVREGGLERGVEGGVGRTSSSLR